MNKERKKNKTLMNFCLNFQILNCEIQFNEVVFINYLKRLQWLILNNLDFNYHTDYLIFK